MFRLRTGAKGYAMPYPGQAEAGDAARELSSSRHVRLSFQLASKLGVLGFMAMPRIHDQAKLIRWQVLHHVD